MTILHDEHKPRKQPTPSDAVVELMAAAYAGPQLWADHFARNAIRKKVRRQLSALSDAGLAVLSKKCTDEMRELGAEQAEQIQDDLANYVAGETPDWDCDMAAEAIWDVMVDAAFHPSQLEKTDE